MVNDELNNQYQYFKGVAVGVMLIQAFSLY